MIHGAFVTAASSGIGAEFARQLGEIGLNVAIVAWRRPRLEELAHELEAKNRVRVKIIQPTCLNRIFYRSSLRKPRAVEIGLLVNNAGFGLARSFLDHELERDLAW
jgi:short-subunit dehydrogenase